MDAPVLRAVVLPFAMLLVGACGLQKHPGSLPSTSQPSETGGQIQDSGGQSGNTGGQSGGSGGSASGGQSGSGGRTETASGGAGDSGGQPGSGGQAGGGGQPGSGGDAGSGGQGGGLGGTGGRPVPTGGSASGGKISTGGTGSGGVGSGGNPGTGGSGSGGSTVGVTINGKFVPKEKAVVFLHIGHSNMRGQATMPTSLKPYFYNTEDGLWSYRGSYTLAKEPTAPEGSMTYAGPGMAILHAARAAVAAGSDVQFISVGYGVGSKTSVDFQKSGAYYPLFIGWANQLKGKVTFGAIVIMLGITERHLASDLIPAFPQRVGQLVSDIRADLGEPDLPVLFCDYEQGATGDLAPTGSVGKVLMPLVRQIPTVVSKLVLVPTDNLEMQDDHHFDMQGHKDWANRVIQLMQTNQWFPWK